MTKFSDLKLDPRVLQAVAEAGYENPTPIQVGAIPPALEGRDVLGIAQTGTGKTAGFVLPMITLLGRGRARARMPRSLVLCPTRELAAQVAENFDIYAKHTRLTKALLIGGVSFGEQDRLIDRGVDVLIATPGRLLDHFERGKLLLTGVQIMVVDEADRMLDMGFIPDIERIFQLTPFTRQTLFFSATMAPEIERITNTFLHAPERVEVARQATTSETITQKLVEITPTRKDQSAKQKRELLRALIDAEGPETGAGGLKNAIIFCNRKTEVDIVAKSLKAHGYDAAPIHGDLEQRQRMATLEEFRDGKLRFLVASDVAARGLDIPAVSHVFNFDLPSHAEDYVHRIGRTGRAGRLGTAISIATPADEKYLTAIENLVKQTLPRADVPEGFSLSEEARSAPRAHAERGPRAGSRTRSRRGEREDRAPRETEETATAAEPAREPRRPSRHAEAVREEPRETAPSDRSADRGTDQRAGRGHGHGSGHGDDEADARRADRREADRDSGRNDRRDDRRKGGRDGHRDGHRDRGPAVVGMGDHVPDFLLTSFRPALAATDARSAAEDDTPPAAQPTTQPAAAVATAVAAKPEPEVAIKAGPAAEAAQPAEAAAEAEAPKPKRTRRPRKKAEPAVEAERTPAAPAAEAEVTQGAPATDVPAGTADEPTAQVQTDAAAGSALTEDAGAAAGTGTGEVSPAGQPPADAPAVAEAQEPAAPAVEATAADTGASADQPLASAGVEPQPPGTAGEDQPSGAAAGEAEPHAAAPAGDAAVEPAPGQDGRDAAETGGSQAGDAQDLPGGDGTAGRWPDTA